MTTATIHPTTHRDVLCECRHGKLLGSSTVSSKQGNEEATHVESIEIEHEAIIDGTPEQVFDALTYRVDHWWMLGFFSPDSSFLLEPSAGGRFYEDFGGKGAALYATVTYIEPAAKIRMSGAMGMRGPVMGTVAYDLAPSDGSTHLTLVHHIVGQMEEGTRDTYTQGWQELFGQLKLYVETGQGYRGQS